MEVGERIKELRTSEGLTQEELGSKLGLKKSAISKYESGRVKNIKRSNIKKLAEIFEVPPAYIMGWIDSPTLTGVDGVEITTDDLEILLAYKNANETEQQIINRILKLDE